MSKIRLPLGPRTATAFDYHTGVGMHKILSELNTSRILCMRWVLDSKNGANGKPPCEVMDNIVKQFWMTSWRMKSGV